MLLNSEAPSPLSLKMTMQTLITPVPTTLPAPPDRGFFSETQWAVYIALAEAILPSLVPESRHTNKTNQIAISTEQYESAFAQVQRLAVPLTRQQFDNYLAESVLDSPKFLEMTQRVIGHMPPGARKRMAGALNLLA